MVIHLADDTQIPILYEDRAILAIDKPPGWTLGPSAASWHHRHIQAALESSMHSGAFWARSRNLRFLRHLHRLDAPTSGILLFAKTLGSIRPWSELFANQQIRKTYLAVALGIPEKKLWVREDPLRPALDHSRQEVSHAGKPSKTEFQFLGSHNNLSLVIARPHTGRTHQIRVHLLASGHPIVGDELYFDGESPSPSPSEEFPLGLRAIELASQDPFTRRPIRIRASLEPFLKAFGFSSRAREIFPPPANRTIPPPRASGGASQKT